MSTKDRKEQILKTVVKLYISEGDIELSMRSIASMVGIAQSVLYHHFKNKEELLKEAFDFAAEELGRLRSQLPRSKDAREMFRTLIRFQLENTDLIMFILMYYTDNRSNFEEGAEGFLPPKSALHIEEVLIRGKEESIYSYDDLTSDSKIIAHSINGFVTEYHCRNISEDKKVALVEDIARFFERALMK